VVPGEQTIRRVRRDPAATAQLTTRYRRQRPGTPFSSRSPASSNTRPEPARRSLTVWETSISDGPPWAASRAPIETLNPVGFPSTRSHSPVARPHGSLLPDLGRSARCPARSGRRVPDHRGGQGARADADPEGHNVGYDRREGHISATSGSSHRTTSTARGYGFPCRPSVHECHSYLQGEVVDLGWPLLMSVGVSDGVSEQFYERSLAADVPVSTSGRVPTNTIGHVGGYAGMSHFPPDHGAPMPSLSRKPTEPPFRVVGRHGAGLESRSNCIEFASM
jgi:hypothetical protein